MKIIHIIAALLVAAVLAGCAQSRSGSVYRADEARRVSTTRTGTVVSVREVSIEGREGALGGIAGAVAGGVLGNQIGGGTGRVITTVVGTVAGGLAGSAIEKEATSDYGLEITVRLDGTNEDVVIVQEYDQAFRPGDRVTIVTSSDGSARVVR